MSMSTSGKSISLKGSAKKVTEFFAYGVNSILYQRGIYPQEQFDRAKKYGLTMLVTSDPELKKYITNFLKQLDGCLHNKTAQKVVVVITDINTEETIERWQFDVESEEANTSTKDESKIDSEIKAVIRQITASVSFLPLIDSPCSFEMLLYTDKDQLVSDAWQLSDAKLVQNAVEMPFRDFSTGIHTVHSGVAFRDL